VNDKIWLAPLTGIVFVILLVVGFGLGGEPPNPSDDSAQEIVDFYADNESDVIIGAILQAIAGAFFIFFAGYLYRTLRAAGAEASAIICFAGAVTFAIGMAIDGMISFTLADKVDDLEPAAVQALSALWDTDFLPFAMGMLVFLMGFGVSIVRHRVLPTWVGWIAIVLSLTAISPAFFVAGIGAAVLIVVTSVVLARRERATGAPPAARTA
jgi:hypothetical protein